MGELGVGKKAMVVLDRRDWNELEQLHLCCIDGSALYK